MEIKESLRTIFFGRNETFAELPITSTLVIGQFCNADECIYDCKALFGMCDKTWRTANYLYCHCNHNVSRHCAMFMGVESKINDEIEVAIRDGYDFELCYQQSEHVLPLTEMAKVIQNLTGCKIDSGFAAHYHYQHDFNQREEDDYDVIEYNLYSKEHPDEYVSVQCRFDDPMNWFSIMKYDFSELDEQNWDMFAYSTITNDQSCNGKCSMPYVLYIGDIQSMFNKHVTAYF